jgi:hypothetical protein
VNENIDLAKKPNSDQIRNAEPEKPASLVLYGSADAICKTLIEDDISIVWKPDGDYVQEFRDRNNSTSGSLIVSNGTLRIGGTGTFKNVTKISACGGVFDVASTKAALTGLQTLEVKDGGRFKFSSSKDVKHFVSGQVNVSIAGGGVVELSQGMSVKVKSVVVDGEAQPEGLYGCVGNPHGAREAVWVEGDGFVSVIASVPVSDVAAVQSRWDGGAEDDLASSAANWADDAAVDLASGGLVAVFAEAGTAANFEDGGVLKGIVFNARDDFTVSAAKPLHLRQAGISAVFDIPQGVKYAYTLNGPYKLDCTQEWRITNGVTLKINGSLAHFNDGETLTLSGAATKDDEDEGIFEVSGDNLVSGTIALKKVRMVMCGTETKPASINGHGGELKILGSVYSSLVLSNSVVRKPVLLEGAELHRRIIVYGGTTNIIAGKMIGSWTPRFYINHKGCLINEGGVGANGNWIVPAGAGKESWWRIRCKPFFDENATIQVAGITISLEAPDNKFVKAHVGNGSRICFGCDYAISNTAADVVFTHPTAEIDLCGYDQLAGQLRFSEGQSVATITSAEPAVYGFTQTNDVTFTGLEVNGAVSLAKYGKGKVTFDNDIVSTGGLTVGEGEFTFGPNGNWLNISNIVVSGTGKLTLPSSGLFSKKVVASVDTSEGGCIQLADGVCQRFASLTVDGVELPAGIYGGASASEGVIRSAAFCAEGSGIAKVGALDFSIIVR